MTTYLYHTKITSNDTADLGYNTYLIDATNNNVTLTLPVIMGDGISFLITRIDTNNPNTNTVTIACDGSDTFSDSQTTCDLLQYQSVLILSDGTTWYFMYKAVF